jgi:hypothetical protein
MNKIITYKSLIASILVVSLLNLFGCYSSKVITKDEFIQSEHDNDLVVVTVDKNQYEFDGEEYKATKDSIIGTGKMTLHNGLETNELFSGTIPLNDIVSIQAGKINWALTLLSAALIVGALVIIGNNFNVMTGF